jgi:hypothetical protein
LGQLEKLQVLGITAGPASLYIGYSQVIQLPGNFNLIIQGKGNSFTLSPIPQGSIVNYNIQLLIPNASNLLILIKHF